MNGKNNKRRTGQKLKAETLKAESPKIEDRSQRVAGDQTHVTPALSPERRGCESGDELLTKQELAARLKVTVRTVENWQQEGLLPYLKISNTIRFYWPDVVAHLSGQLVTQPSGVTRARWGARKESASGSKPDGRLGGGR